MVETTFNLFDLVVLIVTVLSALLSFFRGFIREVLSLGAWITSSIATMYLFPDVAMMVKPYIQNTVIASGFAAMGTFMCFLMTFSILNSIIMRYVKKGSEIGLMDNGLGLIFGVFRAALLLSLAYFSAMFVMSEEKFPQWAQEAKTRPYVAMGARVIEKIAPAYLKDIAKATAAGEDAEGNQQGSIVDMLIPRPTPEEEDQTSVHMATTPEVVKPKKRPINTDWLNVNELQKVINKDEPKEVDVHDAPVK